MAWHESVTAVHDAVQAVVRRETAVTQFIEREGLLARLAFEQKLMAMGNAERVTVVQLWGIEAEETKRYGAAVLEANRKLLDA